MPAKSQNFQLYDSPEQMEPLLPGEHRLGPLLERAGDLIRAADQLAGMCRPGALAGLRTLLRSMNSYYSNKITAARVRGVLYPIFYGSSTVPSTTKAQMKRMFDPTAFTPLL